PFHLTAATLGAFPALRAAAGAAVCTEVAAAPKRAVALDRVLPGGFRRAASPVAVLLFPEVAAGAARTALEPLPPAEALGLLIQSSPLVAAAGMPARAEHLAALRSLAARARALRLRLGRDALADDGALAARVEAALR